MNNIPYVASIIEDQQNYIQKMEGWPRHKLRSLYLSAERGYRRRIYKYASFFPDDDFNVKKATDIIAGQRLWLSKPSSFNDPYDFRANIVLDSDPALLRKYLETSARKAFPAGTKGYRKLRHAAVGRAMRKSLEQTNAIREAAESSIDHHGVCCFAGGARNILMWSHYATSHTGVCYEFDVATDPSVFLAAFPVNYRKHMPTIVYPSGKDKIADDLVLSKSDIWAYEDELRLVNPTGGDIPLPFAGSALKGIILGHRFPDAAKPALAAILAKRANVGLPPPRILRATCLADEYGISVKADRLEERADAVSMAGT